MARKQGIIDGINICAECNCPMVQVAGKMRCIAEAEPEELVATGLIPTKGADGKLTFDLVTKDQQSIQATQALSKSVEIDNVYLEKLGLNLEKIRAYQVKYNMVP